MMRSYIRPVPPYIFSAALSQIRHTSFWVYSSQNQLSRKGFADFWADKWGLVGSSRLSELSAPRSDLRPVEFSPENSPSPHPLFPLKFIYSFFAHHIPKSCAWNKSGRKHQLIIHASSGRPAEGESLL